MINSLAAQTPLTRKGRVSWASPQWAWWGVNRPLSCVKSSWVPVLCHVWKTLLHSPSHSAGSYILWLTIIQCSRTLEGAVNMSHLGSSPQLGFSPSTFSHCKMQLLWLGLRETLIYAYEYKYLQKPPRHFLISWFPVSDDKYLISTQVYYHSFSALQTHNYKSAGREN